MANDTTDIPFHQPESFIDPLTEIAGMRARSDPTGFHLSRSKIVGAAAPEFYRATDLPRASKLRKNPRPSDTGYAHQRSLPPQT